MNELNKYFSEIVSCADKESQFIIDDIPDQHPIINDVKFTQKNIKLLRGMTYNCAVSFAPEATKIAFQYATQRYLRLIVDSKTEQEFLDATSQYKKVMQFQQGRFETIRKLN